MEWRFFFAGHSARSRCTSLTRRSQRQLCFCWSGGRARTWSHSTAQIRRSELTKAIELAKDGDLAALRLCLDRIAPPRKDRPVLFELPPVSSAADAANAAAALLKAVAVGDLTPAEASELGKLIEAYIKALEATDFAERLDKLERMTNR